MLWVVNYSGQHYAFDEYEFAFFFAQQNFGIDGEWTITRTA